MDPIQVHTFQSGFVNAQEPSWNHTDTCPSCGGIKNNSARTCISCSPRRKVRRSGDARDRHHRWNAALLAGWTHEELVGMRPDVPTWDKIIERCPEVVIKTWWNHEGN